MRRRELWRLLRDPAWLSSQVRDVGADAWYRVSPGPFAELYRIVRAYSMCSAARLLGLYRAVEHIAANNVAGDLVECGTARGGSAALMGLAAARRRPDRLLWVFDTFEGLPPPSQDDPDRDIAQLYVGDSRGELSEVRMLFARLGILPGSRLVQGLFQDTLPVAEVRSIAVLHIDGDWYESVKTCLDHLYDRVSTGGVIQLDDYGHWEGARKAVDEFFGRRSIRPRLLRLDYTGRQFIKA
jgi:hypothetical protein